MFENCRESLFECKIISKSQQRFRDDHHNVYTEELNKIALSSNDDKRLQAFDRITTYPYGWEYLHKKQLNNWVEILTPKIA